MSSFIEKASQTDQEKKWSSSNTCWIPTETWADVFKFLSRHILLNQVQPTCRRFHVIADRKVDNVHLICNFDYFLDGLARNLPIANKQKAELVASDASLAKHFRLIENLTFHLNRQTAYSLDKEKRRRLAQMCVLRHSLDLFRGCRLQLFRDNNSNEYLDYLSLLQPTRPFSIDVLSYFADASPEFQMDKLLCMPVMLSCPRVAFYQANVTPSNADSVCKWLHHMPIRQQDDKEQEDNRTRIFNLNTKIMPNICADIIECCKKGLQQSELLTDRRSFLLIFISSTQQMVPFHIEHSPTGEMLYLNSFPHQDWDEVKHYYHLRRCPIADLATTDHFYRDTFDPSAEGLVTYYFRAPVKDGLVAPHLQIH